MEGGLRRRPPSFFCTVSLNFPSALLQNTPCARISFPNISSLIQHLVVLFCALDLSPVIVNAKDSRSAVMLRRNSDDTLRKDFRRGARAGDLRERTKCVRQPVKFANASRHARECSRGRAERSTRNVIYGQALRE